ncbi:MAG: hypothetical protein ACP6IU_05720 [Candidatus Asgardarchaeia archaeon]
MITTNYKVMLDTTFLLPLFGIESDKFTITDFKKLIRTTSKLMLFFSPVSLIELKWLILKKIKKADEKLAASLLSKYNNALFYILYEDYFHELPLLNTQINILEDKLREFGLTDYFDRIIFSAGLTFCDSLLTEDEQIINIWRSEKASLIDKEFAVVTWNQFRQYFGL